MSLSSKVPTPSGTSQCWRLWRHCCCRHGLYPLLVAPVVTAACLLDIYSSLGCEFIDVSVGFSPTNEAWNKPDVLVGLFSFQSGEKDENKYTEAFVGGCRDYSSEFEAAFIDEDRTWKVARIMALISGISGIIASTTAWLMVVTPLRASFFWPGVLLPSILIGFMTEGSKFLFFDTQICHGRLWSPEGDESIPREAQSCSLGRSGIFAASAAAVYLLSVLLVCLKGPSKRVLDDEFGKGFENLGDTEGLRTQDMMDSSDMSYTKDPTDEEDLTIVASNDSGMRRASSARRFNKLIEEKSPKQPRKSLDWFEDEYNVRGTDNKSFSVRYGNHLSEKPHESITRSKSLNDLYSNKETRDVQDDKHRAIFMQRSADIQRSQKKVDVEKGLGDETRAVSNASLEKTSPPETINEPPSSTPPKKSPKKLLSSTNVATSGGTPKTKPNSFLQVAPTVCELPPTTDDKSLIAKSVSFCDVPDPSAKQQKREAIQSPNRVDDDKKKVEMKTCSPEKKRVVDMKQSKVEQMETKTIGSSEELINKCVTELKMSFGGNSDTETSQPVQFASY